MKNLKPIKITCTTTDCENGLHCFLEKKRQNGKAIGGACRACNIELVSWERLHARDLSDVSHTFASLKYETIRHHFWHKEIDIRALNHARRKGRVGLREAAEIRIRKSVGGAKNPFEGRQTREEGNILFYAQHATACCCRKCMEYWHGIPTGRDLTDEEVSYFTELIMLYVDERLPNLTENGEKVPSIRQKVRAIESARKRQAKKVEES